MKIKQNIIHAFSKFSRKLLYYLRKFLRKRDAILEIDLFDFERKQRNFCSS